MFFFIVGNKIFCFFWKISLSFFGRGHISTGGEDGGGGGGSQVLQNFEGCCSKKKRLGGLTGLESLFGGELGKKWRGQYFRVEQIPRRALWCIFGKRFMKMLKNNIHFTTNISIYNGQRNFEVLWSFVLCILQRFVLHLKNSHCAYIPLCMHKTLTALGNEKEQ